MDTFPLALLFIGAMSERPPSKMDDTFCLSAACPAGREKGKNILLAQCNHLFFCFTGVYPVILSKH